MSNISAQTSINHSVLPPPLFSEQTPPLFQQTDPIFRRDITGDSFLRTVGPSISLQEANDQSQRILQTYNLSIEQLHRSQIFHGSSSPSLLTYTDHGQRRGHLMPFSQLLAARIIPFSGEIGPGCLPGRVNDQYLSTTWVGQMEASLRYTRRQLIWSPSSFRDQTVQSSATAISTNGDQQINSTREEPFWYTQEDRQIDQLRRTLEIQRREAWERLNPMQQALVANPFPVLFGIRSNREGDQIGIRSRIRGEIGLRGGALPDEIKVILVPQDKVSFTRALLESHGHNRAPYVEPFNFPGSDSDDE